MAKVVACTMVLIVFLVLGAPALQAQEKTDVGGKLTCAFTDQKQFSIGDAEGHMVSVVQSTGKNASAATGGFMDGADVVNYSVGDLVKGNGPQFGYIMFVMGADTTFAKWDHSTTTTMSPEGKPVTSFGGTFKFTKGTGKYMNIQGDGDYTGVFTSPTEYNADWKGTYTLTK